MFLVHVMGTTTSHNGRLRRSCRRRRHRRHQQRRCRSPLRYHLCCLLHVGAALPPAPNRIPQPRRAGIVAPTGLAVEPGWQPGDTGGIDRYRCCQIAPVSGERFGQCNNVFNIGRLTHAYKPKGVHAFNMVDIGGCQNLDSQLIHTSCE